MHSPEKESEMMEKILEQEIEYALGCTEPGAVALAAAKAREALGEAAETLTVRVSDGVGAVSMMIGGLKEVIAGFKTRAETIRQTAADLQNSLAVPSGRSGGDAPVQPEPAVPESSAPDAGTPEPDGAFDAESVFASIGGENGEGKPDNTEP